MARVLLLLGLVAALVACDAAEGGESADDGAAEEEVTSITIAEPVRSLGYLPLYVAEMEGYFAEEGLDVEITTLAGGGHVDALVSGQVWGFIGGPESGAVANIQGADTVGIANVVNRGNVYFTAVDGVEVPEGDLGAFLDGKTIAGGRFGGTPNAILRHILIEAGLDPDEDVTLTETEDSSALLAVASRGDAEVAVTTEPQLGQGIDEGVWQEPFLNVPAELGPYAYSIIMVDREVVEEDPETAQAFVNALVAAQRLVEDEPERGLELAEEWFPNVEPDVIEETIGRAYDDGLWDSSTVTVEATETALEIARSGQILDDAEDPVDAAGIIDMGFVEEALR